MAQCDMCGKDSRLRDAIVEGTMLSVCPNCAKFGNVLMVANPICEEKPRKLHINKPIEMDQYANAIVPDFSLLIRKARERKDLKQEELAKNIAEKESLIQKIESGHLEPPFDLAKKLEQYLSIKLITKVKESYEKKEININDSSLTIGDLIKFKKK